MTYLYHICVGSCLVIFQTVIMPYFPLYKSFYNILVPFIIYLSVYYSLRESIPVVIILGIIVDNLSGGFFGVYLTTYVWLTMSFKWISTMIDLNNYVLLPLAAVIGVMVENFILFLAITVIDPDFQFSMSIISVVAVQIFWVIFTGPILIIIFSKTSVFLRKEAE